VDDIPALAAKREKRWSMIQSADWMTINEKRKATGFSAIDNPDANVVWGNANAIPIGAASEPSEEGSETFPVDISMSKDKLAMIMDIISKVQSGEMTEDVGRALALKVDPSFDVSLICEPEEEEEEEEEEDASSENPKERKYSPDQPRAADGRFGSGMGSHSVALPKNRRKINISHAKEALGQMGGKLEQEDFDMENMTARYKVTDKHGRSQSMTASDLKDLVYSTRKK
jgi:hypothetical protein